MPTFKSKDYHVNPDNVNQDILLEASKRFAKYARVYNY